MTIGRVGASSPMSSAPIVPTEDRANPQVNFFLSNGFDVRIEHKFELAWGPTWFEWFMTNPGSAETRAAPAPASVSPIQPKKQLPAARPQAKGCNGAKVNAAVAAVSPSRIHAAGAVH